MKRCTWLKPCLWAAIVALLVCGLPAGPRERLRPAPPRCPCASTACRGRTSQGRVGPQPTIWPLAIPAVPRPEPRTMWCTPIPTRRHADGSGEPGRARTASPSTSPGPWSRGFLVMFMQAGFAIVETGLCRAKNANHTMMMNFMVYGFGLFAYWVCGFAIQMGGAAGTAMLGGVNPFSHEFTIHLLGHDWGLSGTKGFFLSGATYDVGVMVLFLFQMVFMDTALTIVTGAAAERWKYVAFCVSSVFLGAFTYPIFANWAWGGGWLSKLGANYGLGAGYADFAGSGVVHAVGGITALALSLIVGPRIGKYNRDGSSNAMPGHDMVIVLTGCFILAFGWFGFNPGSTLGRFRRVAHQHHRRRHHAGGMHGLIWRGPLHVDQVRQTRCLHGGQRIAGRPGGDHCSERLRQHHGSRASLVSSPACWFASASNSLTASCGWTIRWAQSQSTAPTAFGE